MPFERGTDGVILFGASDDRIGHIQSWNLDISSDEVEGWGMGDQWSETFPTIKRWSAAVTVLLDFSDPSATVEIDDTGTLTLFPGGQSTGKRFWTGTARVMSIPSSGTKDGIPELVLNLRGVGILDRTGVVA